LRSLEQAKAEVKDKPAFTEPMVKVMFGDETKEFSLNEKGEIDRWLEELRSGISPKADVPDSADDEPKLTESPDQADDIMERISNKMYKHRKDE